MNPNATRALLGAIAGLGLAGCGSWMPTAPPPTSIVLAGVVQGPPQALTLGGRPLDLSTATITLNGEPAAPTAVAPGVVVTGTGTLSGAGVKVAHLEVRFRAKGAIDQVDLAAGFVDVLGLRARSSPPVSSTTLRTRPSTPTAPNCASRSGGWTPPPKPSPTASACTRRPSGTPHGCGARSRTGYSCELVVSAPWPGTRPTPQAAERSGWIGCGSWRNRRAAWGPRWN